MSTTNWPELAIGLYEKLNERNAELVYEFDNVEVGVPSAADDNAATAKWTINGTVKISSRDLSEKP
ncbi:hypothetical protein HGP28_06750 [Vibrio sp. SM6]|uniref:Uncharacterized protein n=1 Tax=Vibrio agarilyticus TaxID=2726741 RepID=A0A7X8TQ50_9VIBR|nr:hypothetical protein [Vibrio agarilyticus]NLS12601.1 hypothetical protein [Vibrio agarilyticus]